MLDPGKPAVAFTGATRLFRRVFLDQALRQAVDLQNHDPIHLRLRSTWRGLENNRRTSLLHPAAGMVTSRLCSARWQMARVSSSPLCCMILWTSLAERSGIPIAAISSTARRTSSMFHTTLVCGLDRATASRKRVWRTTRRSRCSCASRSAPRSFFLMRVQSKCRDLFHSKSDACAHVMTIGRQFGVPVVLDSRRQSMRIGRIADQRGVLLRLRDLGFLHHARRWHMGFSTPIISRRRCRSARRPESMEVSRASCSRTSA